MINILLASDYHLSETKRIKDFVSSLNQIENHSQLAGNDFDYYINGGDVFHGRHNPTPLELKIFAKHIARVRAKKKVVVIGNHSEISRDLTYLDWAKEITDLQITNCFLEELGGKKVYVAHRAIKEAEVGSYQKRLNELSYTDIQKETGADIIALGHIHKAQLIHEQKPTVIVLGSIERVSFAERNEEKMFWTIKIERNKITTKSIKLSPRPMLYIIYNIDERKLIVNDKKAKTFNPTGAIIKADIFGKKETLKKIDYDKLSEKFNGAYSCDMKFIYTDNLSSKVNLEKYDKSDVEILDVYGKDNELGSDVLSLCKKIMK